MEHATTLQIIGAGAFGVIIGWYLYFINRFRKQDVQIGDLTTVIGVVGGAGITALFKAETDLFAGYGIGLAAGFFGYLVLLSYQVSSSQNFDTDFFLDGRRKRPLEPFYIPGDVAPTVHPMMAAEAVPAPHSATGQAAAIARPRLAAVPAGRAAEIIAACEDEWPANKADCNAFVKDVAARFKVILTGQADDIVTQIQGAGWQQLRDGIEAKQAADAGKLVIGGLQGSKQADPSPHGHVVVVVAGPLEHGRYPSAYWGKLNSVGERNKTINWAWRAGDRDKVVYGARDV
ncbi:hypothetical protein [Azospirillum sp. B2RO_4]|uniref:hypothetical protein n=1 Tax=Azospirillum sp. B2RO_4 TaxID=3027796 RepID=UPI003DA8D6F3